MAVQTIHESKMIASLAIAIFGAAVLRAEFPYPAAPAPFTHPMVFSSTADADYQAILVHIKAAGARLNKIKRFDMPGFQPRYEYLREMKRDGVLPVDFDPKKPTPVNAYELDQKYWQQFWVTPVNPNEGSK